ncbi:MAG TPA: hypothetical protein VGD59_14470 [Acidisarcina sp.]
MRFVRVLALTVLLPSPLLFTPLAFGIDETVPNPQALAALEARADQASPREQCFLYAELVHQMTEQAGRELSAGNPEKASASIQFVQKYAAKIHMGLADDSKRLKTAEILVRHTAYRLKDILRGASADDRPPLEATLKQLDQVQSEMMLAVFKH